MEYYTITCPYAETFVLHYDTLMSFGMSYDTYDEERQAFLVIFVYVYYGYYV